MVKWMATLVLCTFLLGCGRSVIEPPCAGNDPASGDRFRSMGIVPYLQLGEALSCSKRTGRPVLLFLHGWAVFSNHKPWEIFEDDDIRRLIEDHFVLCVLFVDDREPLSAKDTLGFPPLDRAVSTKGQQSSALQVEYFHTSACPTLAVLDPDMHILVGPLGWPDLRSMEALTDTLRSAIPIAAKN